MGRNSRSPRAVERVAIALMTLSVVGSAAAVYGARRVPAQPDLGAAVTQVNDPAGLAAAARVEGSLEATHRVTVFGDYQCPACKSFQYVLDSLIARDSSVSVGYRHFPLAQLHPLAAIAAVAAECAATQERFGEMHRLLFQHQQSLREEAIGKLAEAAGVPDTGRFRACLVSGDPNVRINIDIAAGQRIGVLGTPSFLVGDSLYAGARTVKQMQELLERQVGRSP